MPRPTESEPLATGSPPPDDLLTAQLRDVSRSFYLTLKILPRRVRSQIGLAYLLARATDTIADTEIVPAAGRLEALRQLRGRILREDLGKLDFSDLSARQDNPAEHRLLLRCEEMLERLERFSPPDQAHIRQVLAVISSAQIQDIERFPRHDPPRITALQSLEELDEYTYAVAGCVGEFWTRLCCDHLLAGSGCDPASLLADGIRFGKGLQLVNILRDIPEDLQRGRCYIPRDLLERVKLTPEDLLNPASGGRFRPVHLGLLRLAQDHLRAGWDYACALPIRHFRLRLACAWPILIGLQTLTRLAGVEVLDSSQRVKISRSDVRRIMVGSLAASPFPPLWRRLAHRHLAPLD